MTDKTRRYPANIIQVKFITKSCYANAFMICNSKVGNKKNRQYKERQKTLELCCKANQFNISLETGQEGNQNTGLDELKS